MPFSKEALKAGKLKYLEAMAGDTPDSVPVEEQFRALQDEVAHVCAVLDQQAQADQICWGFAKARQKQLRAAVATLRRQHEAANGPTTVRHVDDGTEIDL